MLVLEDLVGTQPLNGYLASGGLADDPHDRQHFFTALGREVARLHAQGFRQPDLYSNHIHVARHDEGWRFAFLDFQRSVQSRRVSIRHRVPDLAALLATLSPRLARQRDVQVFFADASSGAGSTAFVRQGQIGTLISQKPLARRAILEEAAGIGGLHQRRHEAELRLKAAESNMARLDDIIREVEAGLQNLRKQARQAARLARQLDARAAKRARELAARQAAETASAERSALAHLGIADTSRSLV